MVATHYWTWRRPEAAAMAWCRTHIADFQPSSLHEHIEAVAALVEAAVEVEVEAVAVMEVVEEHMREADLSPALVSCHH